MAEMSSKEQGRFPPELVPMLKELLDLCFVSTDFQADDHLKQQRQLEEQRQQLGEVRSSMLTRQDLPLLVQLVMETIQQKRKEKRRMSATKTIPQLNQEHEALCKFLKELVPKLDALGIFLTDQPKAACGHYRELLGDPPTVDASEDALDELEYRLEHLGPLATLLSKLAVRMEEERRQHKQELNGWKSLGQLDQVAPLLASAKTREEVMKRLTEEACRLREEKKQLTGERDRMKVLCKQATNVITRLREERDHMKGLCAQATAALKAKVAGGA